MALTLADLDAMEIPEAQALTMAQRNQLLDLIIADGRGHTTGQQSYRSGLYSDYFEEDFTRFLKVKAVKVLCRGTTPSGFDGVMVGETDEEQYRAAFKHVDMTLKAASTSFGRVVTLVVFLTDMGKWSLLNQVYREFIPNPPCRAVIGTTGLAQQPLAIEIVECFAYRVAP